MFYDWLQCVSYNILHYADIDECKENPNICPGDFFECNNTKGSYTCICKDGYIQVGEQCIRKYPAIYIYIHNSVPIQYPAH